MGINKTFNFECPTCKQADKVIMKCKKCNKLCCSGCSHHKICIDCVTEIDIKKNLSEYFDENIGVYIPE